MFAFANKDGGMGCLRDDQKKKEEKKKKYTFLNWILERVKKEHFELKKEH